MRMVLIDLGCHKGLYTHEFLLKNKDFYGYGFEPNSELHWKIKKNTYMFKDRFELIKDVAWIYDGEIEFYISDHPKGSTNVLGKLNVQYKNKMVLKCIDFSKWIINNFSVKDFIHLKMDIEGSEYAILEKMINDGSINFIKELKVEFHLDKIDNPEITRQKHDFILSELKKLNILVKGSKLLE